MLAGCPCWQSPPLSDVITMRVSGHIPLECSTAVLPTTRHSLPSQQQQHRKTATTDKRGFRSYRLPRPLSTALSIEPQVWSQKREGTELFGICSQTGGSSNGPCPHNRLKSTSKTNRRFFGPDCKGGRRAKGGKRAVRGRIGRSDGGRRVWTCRGLRSARSRGSCSNSPSLTHHLLVSCAMANIATRILDGSHRRSRRRRRSRGVRCATCPFGRWRR